MHGVTSKLCGWLAVLVSALKITVFQSVGLAKVNTYVFYVVAIVYIWMLSAVGNKHRINFCNQPAVHGCRAGVDGGAIALEYHAQKPVAPYTVIVACNVTNNTAQSEGGGLIVRAGVTSLINNVFMHNRASMGGAVFFATDAGGKLPSQMSFKHVSCMSQACLKHVSSSSPSVLSTHPVQACTT